MPLPRPDTADSNGVAAVRVPGRSLPGTVRVQATAASTQPGGAREVVGVPGPSGDRVTWWAVTELLLLDCQPDSCSSAVGGNVSLTATYTRNGRPQQGRTVTFTVEDASAGGSRQARERLQPPARGQRCPRTCSADSPHVSSAVGLSMVHIHIASAANCCVLAALAALCAGDCRDGPGRHRSHVAHLGRGWSVSGHRQRAGHGEQTRTIHACFAHHHLLCAAAT